MQKITLQKPEMMVTALKTRTSNAAEFNPETAKIGALMGVYFGGGLSQKIQNRKNPGVTLSIYTEYESDHTGPYTYYLGEETASFDSAPETFSSLTIPGQTYLKFTTHPGSLPEIVIDAWQKIWAMTPQDFGAQRSYIADFELYDARCADPSNAIVDIYIGLKS